MNRFTRLSLSICLLILATAFAASAQKLKTEEILAKHLESIGTAEARAAAKTMMTVGDATVKFISQKNQEAVGRIVMASSAEKNFFGLQLNDGGYPGEKISWDGSKVKIATLPDGKKSMYGGFVGSNEMVVKDSLMGGVLATSWVAGNTVSKKGKLSADGMKKVDGKDAYVIKYSPKGGSDMTVELYFDKDTFRHIRTEYKFVLSSGIGANIDQSARETESRLTISEKFSDFKVHSGLTLPQKYVFNYTLTSARNNVEIEWNYALNEFAFNQAMDAKTFDIDAK